MPGRSKYWVYKSVDGGETYGWIGRTFGETSFVDPEPTAGALYQVHYDGIPRVECVVSLEPSVPDQSFSCQALGGELTWTDDGQSKYWVYKSVDGGATYGWIGRTFGETAFSDPNPTDDALYQVHYDGIPRVNCTTTIVG